MLESNNQQNHESTARTFQTEEDSVMLTLPSEIPPSHSCKLSYLCILVILQIMSCVLQVGAFSTLAVIRGKSGSGIFEGTWFVAFAIVTLIAMNAGAFVLCFRRKKYVCLFALCELASFILFAFEVYTLITSGEAKKLTKGSLRNVTITSSAMILSRFLLFIVQSLIIIFRLKY